MLFLRVIFSYLLQILILIGNAWKILPLIFVSVPSQVELRERGDGSIRDSSSVSWFLRFQFRFLSSCSFRLFVCYDLENSSLIFVYVRFAFRYWVVSFEYYDSSFFLSLSLSDCSFLMISWSLFLLSFLRFQLLIIVICFQIFNLIFTSMCCLFVFWKNCV